MCLLYVIRATKHSLVYIFTGSTIHLWEIMHYVYSKKPKNNQFTMKALWKTLRNTAWMVVVIFIIKDYLLDSDPEAAGILVTLYIVYSMTILVYWATLLEEEPRTYRPIKTEKKDTSQEKSNKAAAIQAGLFDNDGNYLDSAKVNKKAKHCSKKVIEL